MLKRLLFFLFGNTTLIMTALLGEFVIQSPTEIGGGILIVAVVMLGVCGNFLLHGAFQPLPKARNPLLDDTP